MREALGLDRKRGLLVLFSHVYFGWALRKQIRKDSTRKWPSEGAFSSWIASSVWGCAVVRNCWAPVNRNSESWDDLGVPPTLGRQGPWHRDQTRGSLSLRPAPRATVLPLCFRFSHSKERRRQLPGPERAPKEKRQGRKAGGAGETSAQGSRAVSGAGLGGWGLQVFASVCALRRAERGVYRSRCWLCFPCSAPSSALPLTPRQDAVTWHD